MDYVAQLDDFYLDIINIADNFSYSIAVHEFPFTNNNKLEHLGGKTRSIKINCVFTENPTDSEGWSLGLTKPSYENHYDFLDHIKNGKLFNFVHPKYGTLQGSIPVISVTQDDSINYAAVNFDFLVQDSASPSYLKPIEAQQAAAFSATSTSTISDAASSRKLARNLQSWTARTQLVINQMDAYLNSVTAPATSIANTIYYASDLPSQLVGSINNAIDRALTPILAVQTSPAATLNNLSVAMTGVLTSLTDAFPDTNVTEESKYIWILGASRVSYEAAKIYEEDNQKGKDQKRQENQRVFDESGNFVGAQDYEEILTIDELDSTLFKIKGVIDNAVQLDREKRDLKAQGSSLQKYINQIKLNRERIITKEIPLNSMHSIANSNGLPYQRAEQLLKLNPRIKNPTFASGDIRLLTKDA